MKIEQQGYISPLNASELVAKHGEEGALQAAGEQFEAYFLQTVLKQMRSATDAMADDDNPLSSSQDGVFRELHDAELATALSHHTGVGLAETMVEQLSPALKTSPLSDALPEQDQVQAMQPAILPMNFMDEGNNE